MIPTPIGGQWRVVDSTDPTFREGMTVSFVAQPDGLVTRVAGGPSSITAWGDAGHSVAADGRSIVETAGGMLWLEALGGARASELGVAIAARRLETEAPARHDYPEYAAGEGQVLVLYASGDTGDELDPAALLAVIASDAASRSRAGWRMASMVSLPLRHAGVKGLGVSGSGYTTKAALGALYLRQDPDSDWLSRAVGPDEAR